MAVEAYTSHIPAIRKGFEDRGISIKTGSEDEETRLNRIAREVASGSRTLNDVYASLDRYKPPPVAAPATRTPKSLDELRADRLAATQSAIDADFASQRGGFEQGLQGIISKFRRGERTLQREAGNTERSVGNNALSRGIFGTGVSRMASARALAPILEAQADNAALSGVPAGMTVEDLIALIGDESAVEGLGTDIRSLLSSIGLLDQQKASADATAQIDSEMSALELEILREQMRARL